jgi:hypothetical protein
VVGSALDEPDEGVASDLVEEPDGEEELYDEEPERAPVRDETYLEDDEGFDDDDPFAEDEHLPADREPLAEEEDPHRTKLMRTVDVPVSEDATAEHDVEQSFAREDVRDVAPRDHEDADGEDVLEETPEFLQDTPDHDRLWFEQRPPRDFDFDG